MSGLELPAALPLLHALSGRADLPIPVWLFGWAAAIVLVLSFVALASLWRTPKLEHAPTRPFPPWLSRVLTSRAVELLLGGIGVAGLVVTIWAGFAGTEVVTDNIAPTLVFVIVWVGGVAVSALFGDLFRPLNPWRAIGRASAWALARASGGPPPAPLPYPKWLGYLPAVVGLVAFAWLELIARGGETPRNVAAATLIYSGLTFVGMALYGVEQWCARGEAFGVYFGLFGRMAPFAREGDRIVLRRPLSGLTQVDPAPWLPLLLGTMLGTVTYDGFQEGPTWGTIAPWLEGGLDGAFGAEGARLFAEGLGLFACIGALTGFYLLGIAGARRATGWHEPGLATAFAHTLVPIAMAYVLAHYATLAIFQGQGFGSLVSDPLGRGWDVFGSASLGIDFGVINATQTWYLQVALVVVGHVAGLALAHDRALVLFRRPRDAWRSQLALLVVMIGLTSFALWLLSQANQ